MKSWLSLFFLFFFIFNSTGQTQKELIINGITLVNNNGIQDIIIRNERSNETTISITNGHFNIKCQLGDILNFSSMNIETKRKKITTSDFQTNSLQINLSFKTIDLKEVLVNNNSITAEKLGIISANQKKYTPAERRLKTAGDFKPIHLLSILGGSLPLDPIINKITGRTKRLKKELEIEKKERLLNRLKSLYHDDFYLYELNIPKVYLESFRYFCIENQIFISHLTAGDNQLLAQLINELAITFNNNLANEN